MEPIVHTQETYGMRPGAEEFPLMVVIAMSYVCNAHCRCCPFTIADTRKHFADVPFIKPKLFKKIADEAGKYNSFLRVTGGGEPLLHPQAMELFLYAKKQGCKLGIISNGSCYTPDTLEELIHAGVDTLEFSVDAGNAEEYALVRTGLDWDVLNVNVSKALELRKKHRASTRIICSIVNQTGIDIPAAEAYWGAFADKVQIRKFLTWRVNSPEMSADAAPYLPVENCIPCPILFERTRITPRGDVNFCGVDMYNAYVAGSIETHSLKEIWHNDIYERARTLHLKGRGNEVPPCVECPDREYRSWKYNFWKILEDTKHKGGS